MKYRVELKPKAIKDMKALPKPDAARVANALESLCDNLAGDVRKLTNHTPDTGCGWGHTVLCSK